MSNTITKFDSSDYYNFINIVMVLGGWHFHFFSLCDFICFSKIRYILNKTKSFEFHFVYLLKGTNFEAFAEYFIIRSSRCVELCCQSESANKGNNVVHLVHVPNS